MATTPVILTRKGCVRLKQQSDKTEAVTTTLYLLLGEPEMQRDSNLIARGGVHPYSGSYPGISGPQTGRMTFRGELISDGTSALDDGVEALMQGAGWKLSAATYSPAETVALQTCLTLDLYRDGLLKRLSSAMGSLDIDIVAGQPVGLVGNYLGKWAAPTDVALPTPSYPSRLPFIAQSITFTIATVAVRCQRISIRLQPTIIPREDVSASEGIGYFCITAFDPIIEVDPEAELVAAHDIYGALEASTEQAFSAVLSDGKVTATITAAKLQAREIINEDRGGKRVHRVIYQPNVNTDADCIQIVTAAVT